MGKPTLGAPIGAEALTIDKEVYKSRGCVALVIKQHDWI